MISKVIFDTRNPFKSPRKSFGIPDGRTYLLTYELTHTIKFEDLTSVYYVTGRCGIKFEDLTSVYYVTGRCGIKSEDLTPLLRIWSFRIKGVPQRPAVKDISRKSPCETYIHPHMYSCIHTYIHTHIHTIFHPTFRLNPPYIHTYIHT